LLREGGSQSDIQGPSYKPLKIEKEKGVVVQGSFLIGPPISHNIPHIFFKLEVIY